MMALVSHALERAAALPALEFAILWAAILAPALACTARGAVTLARSPVVAAAILAALTLAILF